MTLVAAPDQEICRASFYPFWAVCLHTVSTCERGEIYSLHIEHWYGSYVTTIIAVCVKGGREWVCKHR